MASTVAEECDVSQLESEARLAAAVLELDKLLPGRQKSETGQPHWLLHIACVASSRNLP